MSKSKKQIVWVIVAVVALLLCGCCFVISLAFMANSRGGLLGGGYSTQKQDALQLYQAIQDGDSSFLQQHLSSELYTFYTQGNACFVTFKDGTLGGTVNEVYKFDLQGKDAMLASTYGVKTG